MCKLNDPVSKGGTRQLPRRAYARMRTMQIRHHTSAHSLVQPHLADVNVTGDAGYQLQLECL